MQWWAVPVAVWFALVLVCGIVANLDVLGAELAACSMFIAGTLLCASLGFACYLVSG